MRRFATARLVLCTLAVCGLSQLWLPSSAHAQDWTSVGYGRIINNDFLGDLKDRGQTGSVQSSRIYTRLQSTQVPTRAFDMLEFRIGVDIKSPDNLVTPAAGDRPYAASAGVGLHTHYRQNANDITMGVELVATGAQTGLDGFQTAFHDAIGVASPSARTKANQIADGFHPGVITEIGRNVRLSDRSKLRPFVEGRYGVETLLRVGVDITFGAVGQSDLMIRDGVTGQRYRAVLNRTQGMSFTMGIDTAVVSESIYLPVASGYTLSDRRDRARAGVIWQGKRTHGFFGMTYLGREYTTQASEQVVGSIRLKVEF